MIKSLHSLDFHTAERSADNEQPFYNFYDYIIQDILCIVNANYHQTHFFVEFFSTLTITTIKKCLQVDNLHKIYEVNETL